jgi:hypothetical protein
VNVWGNDSARLLTECLAQRFLEARYTHRHIQSYMDQKSYIDFLGAFTLGVRDSRVESPNIIASHLGLKPTYHEHFLMLS